MATLDISLGWSNGDQARLLIASGLTIGSYQIDQITIAMNQLGIMAPDAVGSVLDLIDQFEAAQDKFSVLSNQGDSRILVKADVLEWAEAKGFTYNPQSEILRIRILLKQYFSFSELYNDTEISGTRLMRS